MVAKRRGVRTKTFWIGISMPISFLSLVAVIGTRFLDPGVFDEEAIILEFGALTLGSPRRRQNPERA
jgi:hypothetical protein